MSTLSDRQIDIVHQKIEERGVNLRDLKNDLVDHLCCMIEDNLDDGYSFKASYQKAFDDFGAEEMRHTQTEISQLLISKHFSIMKRRMYLVILLGLAIGVVSQVLFQQGSINKLIMIYCSLGSLLTMSAGLAGIFAYSSEHRRSRYTRVAGGIGFLMLSLGSIFTITHIPSARVLVMLGIFLLSVSVMPYIFYSFYHRTKGLAHNQNLKMTLYVMGYIGVFCTMMGGLLKLQHWPGANVLLISGLVLLNVFLLPVMTLERPQRTA